MSVKFDWLKQIEAKPTTGKRLSSLANGKPGEFTVAMNSNFRGESDCGQVDLPVNAVTKVVFT